MIWIEIGLVLALISLNGFFAMSELAVLSARKSRLKQQAEAGDRPAQLALSFRADTSRFLASIQIGITLVGILTGVFSGATLAEQLAALLQSWQLPAQPAQALAMLVIVALITFLTLVFGELLPKQLALRHPDLIARKVALPIGLLNMLVSPLVHLLSLSTRSLLTWLQQSTEPGSQVLEDDVIQLLEEGYQAGVYSAEARQVMTRAIALERIPLAELMTPRHQWVSLDLSQSTDALRAVALAQPHSCYPVFNGDPEQLLGMVTFKHLLVPQAGPLPVQPALYLPEDLDAYEALDKFRHHRQNQALVFDPHGQVQGIVSLSDILLAFTGRNAGDELTEFTPGRWRAAGDLSLDAFCQFFDCRRSLAPEHAHTLSGLILYLAGGIPEPGAQHEWEGLQLNVESMQGPRIETVLIQRRSENRTLPNASPN
ncbi:MAG: hypothetical protein CVV27_10200 [Candidatus Melainabacteria bacterium HGW-Melainabacteria-1]|nr:MAG: hypothetical protein CVV27_10200 [Candidatus Melainabacteria bacterium HGW-Melainabacteria-1]